MRGARQRARRDEQKTLGPADRLVGLELFGRHEALHRMVLLRRLQILADGHEVDIGRAQIVHELQDLVPLFAQADHDARLGEDRGIKLLHPLQQPDRMEIARAGPNGQIVRRHGFEIVVEHVGLCRDDDLQRAVLAQEVGRQDFDRRCRRRRADGANNLRKMLGAAVVEIVAVDRGDDDMGQAHLLHRIGDARRLVVVERGRDAGRDVAEGAGARADLAHDHEGGVLLVPALADVGAAGLLADRDQLVRLHDLARVGVTLRGRRLDADPVGLAQHLLVGPVGLLGMPDARCVGDAIEDGDHDVFSSLRSPWRVRKSTG